jgi:hypothetical protein
MLYENVADRNYPQYTAANEKYELRAINTRHDKLYGKLYNAPWNRALNGRILSTAPCSALLTDNLILGIALISWQICREQTTSELRLGP